jgi:tRNA threonylcarbamoyladenosine biosynthesis protein TsaB
MILCLETAFDTCSVALYDPAASQLIAESSVAADRKHTELLLPMVEQLLADHELTMSEVQAIAFNRGPGAFTGLRINTAAAQGLATALGIGCIPVSSLRAIAEARLVYKQSGSNQGIVSVIDARMDEFYLASYTVEGDCKLVEADAEQLMDVESAAHWLTEKAAEGFSVVSPEASRINVFMKKMGLAEILTDQSISAVDIGRVALGLSAVEPHLAQPVYLRHNAWKTIDQQQKSR